MMDSDDLSPVETGEGVCVRARWLASAPAGPNRPPPAVPSAGFALGMMCSGRMSLMLEPLN